MLVLIHQRPRRTPWVSSSAMQVAHGAVGRTANPLKKKRHCSNPSLRPFPILAFYLSPIPSPNPIRKSMFHEKREPSNVPSRSILLFCFAKTPVPCSVVVAVLKGVLFDVSVCALCTIHPMQWIHPGKRNVAKVFVSSLPSPFACLLACFETFKRRVCK